MHDISISAEALRAASNWAMEGENAAPVQLLVIDGVLFAYQGDEHAAYDSTGTLVESSSVEFVEEPKLNQHLETKLEILRLALKQLAYPDFQIKPTGQDAKDMAAFARRELDKAEEAS